MTIKAENTRSGQYYRLARASQHPGAYYMRVTPRARDAAARKLRKRDLLLLDVARYKDLAAADAAAAGAAVLMARFVRTTIIPGGARRESCAWVLLPKDCPMERITKKPEYWL